MAETELRRAIRAERRARSGHPEIIHLRDATNAAVAKVDCFTEYDVARLEDSARRLDESGYFPDEVRALRSLADRIARLLPEKP